MLSYFFYISKMQISQYHLLTGHYVQYVKSKQVRLCKVLQILNEATLEQATNL